MFRIRNLLIVLTIMILIGLLFFNCAHASYPERPIQIVVPYGPGGASDVNARMIAKHIGKYLPANIAVINITGAGGVIGMQEVKNAEPDGYKLLLHHVAMQVAYHTGTADFDYDSFTPICQLIESGSSAIVVSADHPWETIADLVSYVKKNPGGVRFGTTIGGNTHLMAAGVAVMTDTEFTYVPTGGTADQIAQLEGRHIDATIFGTVMAMPFEEENRFRSLVTFSSQRDEFAPHVPTLREEGIDFVYPHFTGVFGPKGIPSEVIETLNEAFSQLAKDEDFKKDVQEALGVSISYLDHESYLEALKNYSDTIKKLTISAGIYK